MPFIRVIPKENYFNKCPIDILHLILNSLNDLSLIRITATCKKFLNLALKKRSVIVEKGYQQWKVSCPNVYQIPYGIIPGFDEDEEISLIREKRQDGILTHLEEISLIREKRQDGILTQDELRIALEYLKEFQVPLKRGDLIRFLDFDIFSDWGVHIFDGKGIQHLNALECGTYGAIPMEFKVIDEFPIKYFHSNLFSNGHRGIRTNAIVWFNQLPYLDQLLANVRFDSSILTPGCVSIYGDIIYTFFIHKNGRTYYIVFEPTSVHPSIDVFKQRLSSNVYFHWTDGHRDKYRRDIEILFLSQIE